MDKKDLAKKRNKKAYGSVTRKRTSGRNKSKNASVDNELAVGTLKDEVMRKAVVGRSKREESAAEKSSKSKDVDLDDDLKIGARKTEVMRKASGNKPRGEKSVAKQGRSKDVTVDDNLTMEVLKTKVRGKVAGDKSKGEKSVAKKSSKLKDSDVDDALKIGVLKDVARRQVSGGKSMGEKSGARKGKAGGGAKLIVKEEDAEETMMEDSKEDTSTPVKRRRGADGEIVRAFFLSPDRSSSRLRPRKEVPAFRLVDLGDDDNDKIIGKRVKVYWSGSRKWFTGCVKAFDYEKKLHNILYEDGDREMLDLRKERFELEIMPTDSFKLRTKPNSDEVKGLDGEKVGAETLNEDIEMVDAEKVAKQLEPKKKTPSERSSKEGKDPEDNNAEEVDVLSEKAKQVVIDEALNVEEPPDASNEKEQDESKMDEEATEVVRTESNSEVKELRSDNVEGSRKTMKDDFIKVGNAKSEKKRVSSKKRATPRAVKKRSFRSQSRKESEEKEDLDANVEVVSHLDEIKNNIIHGDVDVDKSMEANYQEDGEKTDSIAKEQCEEKCGISSETQHDTTDLNVEKKEDDLVEKQIEIEDRKVSKEVRNRLSLSSNPQCVEDGMDDLAENAEVSVLPNEVEEKVRNRKINVEGPMDVDTGKNFNETETLLKAANEGACDMSGDVLPKLPKAQEEDPEILQGKLTEISESEEGICQKGNLTRHQG